MTPLLLLALITATPPAALARAEKTDLVVIANGNEILGELKSLSRGTLKLKTDSAGTIAIEWDEVLKVTSPSRFRFETVEGHYHVGKLLPSPKERVLVIEAEDGERHSVETAHVIRIAEYDQEFWDRVDGYLSAGFSFTKASDIVQYSYSAGFSYYERLYQLSLDSNLTITEQKDEDTARKADLKTDYKYLFEDRWFAFSQGELQNNSELGLDLRATLASGPGRFLIQDQTHTLASFFGLAVTHEVPEDDSSNTELEGFLGSEYEIFISDTPETSLSLSVNIFPGITESDRMRAAVDLALNKELVEDFFWSITSYLDYDSNPSSDDGEESDFGIVTGISYSW